LERAALLRCARNCAGSVCTKVAKRCRTEQAKRTLPAWSDVGAQRNSVVRAEIDESPNQKALRFCAV